MYRGLNLRPKKERIELSQYRSLQELHATMRIALAAYWPVLALLFVFLAFHQWIIATASLPKTYSLVDIILGNILMMTPVLLAIRLYHFARHGMPKSPLRQLLWDFRSTLNDPGSMIVIAVLVVFTKVYMDVKTNIPSVVLFSWDETFMQLDRWLHSMSIHGKSCNPYSDTRSLLSASTFSTISGSCPCSSACCGLSFRVATGR